MSVYKTKEFSRFARKATLKDDQLLEAAEAVADGLWDANLGGGVFKQRIAREGGGKSGGFRTIILFKVLLSLDPRALEKACASGEIAEVKSDGEDDKQD